MAEFELKWMYLWGAIAIYGFITGIMVFGNEGSWEEYIKPFMFVLVGVLGKLIKDD